jgi:perosamine synthetase
MLQKMAIDGGSPVRGGTPIPLAKVIYGYEELQFIIDVFRQGIFCETYPGAKFTRQFEAEFAELVGIKHAIAFSSGTTAQHASLAAINVGPGNEVIVPSLTFASTAYTVVLQNAVPIFADSDLGTFNLDPDDVKKKITHRTKAIVPVHWFGHPADIDPILQLAKHHNLKVIEDCAHAMGTEYKSRKAGTMGDMACFSFQETKSLTTGGDGGMLVTNDDALAERARMVKNHGMLPRIHKDKEVFGPYQITTIGNNYRMSELQSAFGLAQLRRFDYFRNRRRECTEFLDQHLNGIDGLILQDRSGDVAESYLYYPVRFDSRRFTRSIGEISAALLAEGVENFPELAEASHLQPLFVEKVGYGAVGCPYKCPFYDGDPKYGWGTLPNAERIALELMILPLHPALTEKDLGEIVTAVTKVRDAYVQ